MRRGPWSFKSKHFVVQPWGASQFLAGGACRAATSSSAWSGRNGPPRTAVAPLYAALLVAARRVPPYGDAAPCNQMRCTQGLLRREFALSGGGFLKVYSDSSTSP